MPLRLTLSAAITALSIAVGAAAAKEQSRVTYYPVTGETAAEVYTSIKTSSPRVVANATFAFTLIATKTDKKSALKNGVCTYTSFKTSAIYVFYVPKHRDPQKLRKATRAKWNDFTSYLLRHEEGHRAIWRECFRTYDAKALSLKAKTCEALDKLRERTFTAIKRQCLGRDESYDFVFRKDVLRHPFVVEALKREKDSK